MLIQDVNNRGDWGTWEYMGTLFVLAAHFSVNIKLLLKKK